MNFDPTQLANLAKFARELDAADGERYDDLRQARTTEQEAELHERISKLKNEAEAIQKITESLWTQHSDQQRQVHRDITEDATLTDRQRMARLFELLRGSYDLATIKHFESNIAAYQALRRTQHWYERQLDRMTHNEG